MAPPAPTITSVTLNVITPVVSSIGLNHTTSFSVRRLGGVEGELGSFDPTGVSTTVPIIPPMVCNGEKITSIWRLRNDEGVVLGNTVTGGVIEVILHLSNGGSIAPSGDIMMQNIMLAAGSDVESICLNGRGEEILLPVTAGNVVRLRWTNPFSVRPLTQIRLMGKRIAPPNGYEDPDVDFKISMPGGECGFDTIPSKEQNVTVFVPTDGEWYFTVLYEDPDGNVIDDIIPDKNLVSRNIGLA